MMDGRWLCLRMVVRSDALWDVAQLIHRHGASGFEERARESDVELLVYSEDRGLLQNVVSALRHNEVLRSRLVSASIGAVDDTSWTTTWTEYLLPQPLGDSFEIVPIAQRRLRDPARRPVYYSPELAFGDGGHPSTQMAALAVEKLCRQRPIAKLLDVGAGNGVLSFIAHFSGVRSVLGVEIDDVALQACRQNARLNSIDEERCRFTAEGIDLLDETFDIVVANIELRPLLKLIPQMAPKVEHGGELILTGFLDEAKPLVANCLDTFGFTIREQRSLDGWVLFRASSACVLGILPTGERGMRNFTPLR